MQGRLQEIFSTPVVFPLLLVGLDCTCDGMFPHLSFKQNISSVLFETLNEYTHTQLQQQQQKSSICPVFSVLQTTYGLEVCQIQHELETQVLGEEEKLYSK